MSILLERSKAAPFVVQQGLGDSTIDVLHLARSVGRRSFGVGVAARGFSFGHAATPCRAQLWSIDTPAELGEIGSVYDQRVCRGFSRIGSERLALSPSLIKTLRGEAGSKFQILHQHGLWSGCSFGTIAWRSRFGRPTVVAPHGTLDAWALGRSSVKKQIARALYEARNLRNATCLHALSQQEAAAIRAFGLRNPIAIVGNGVSAEWLESAGDAGAFRKHFSIRRDRRIMLFLSRVTPKKGLRNLLKAMATSHDFQRDWLVVIAGADEFGHAAELRALASDLHLEDQLLFAGPLYGDDRRNAFEAAEVFVLPTFSEGHPMVILEALGAGVPVLSTKGAPCEFLQDENCGWQVEIGSQPLKGVLATLGRMSPAELRAMGERGRELARRRFTWTRAAQQMTEVYRWILNLGPRPEFVLTS